MVFIVSLYGISDLKTKMSPKKGKNYLQKFMVYRWVDMKMSLINPLSNSQSILHTHQ